jgi:hypothetical protein
MLPFFKVLYRDMALEAKQSIEEREGPDLPFVRPLEEFNLPDGCVTRVIRAHMKMTGICAHAAMQAAVQIRRCLRVEVLDEVMHRLIDAFFVGHVALFVVTNLGRLVGQPFSLTIQFVSSVYGGHVLAPLRSNTIPVVPRVTNTRNV